MQAYARTHVRQSVKHALTRAGGAAPLPVRYRLRRAVDCLEVGAWLSGHGYQTGQLVTTHFEVFDLAAREIADARVLYLEFGVAAGESLGYWSRLLGNPESRLHGFDTFEGLPTGWDVMHPKGRFSENGNVPVFDDPRVQLHKGLFSETLPTYEPPAHDILFANVDADLYSSSVEALQTVQPLLKAGSFLYFDEFDYPADELRAFDEFLADSRLRFELVCSSRGFRHVLFRCCG